MPSGYVAMEHQVAGHKFQDGTDQIGLLKNIDDGSVMKPAGSREIKFYEQLLSTTDPVMIPMREFTSEYRGTQTLTVGHKTIKFIKLRDLTNGMVEPCVIDLKMGKITWDPLASEQKKEAEESKYKACKDNLGFCVPGFQTYQLSSNVMKKYGKDYGKKLNENSVKDALRLFLNADTKLCHQLVMQILTNLWAIQKWMRSQKNFQLFSSSILIIYDARRLRQMIDLQNQKRDGFLNGDSSPGSLTGELFPPQFNRNCGTFGSLTQDVGSSPPSPTSLSYRKKQRSHSSINNYEQQMKKMHNNYVMMLDNLSGAYENNKEWVYVKMIDFAHTFTHNEKEGQQPSLDHNYLEGIENLVRLFEGFLKECE
ncbi:unnamed protein product [Diamesa hyperborea]